jgi:hypothetical protein
MPSGILGPAPGLPPWAFVRTRAAVRILTTAGPAFSTKSAKSGNPLADCAEAGLGAVISTTELKNTIVAQALVSLGNFAMTLELS